MSTETMHRDFLTEPSSEGGVDLFRKSLVGFVLVDTFDTPAAAHAFVDEFRRGESVAEPADGTRAAVL